MDGPKTSITKVGYGIRLDSITKSELTSIKKDLTVQPEVYTDYQKDNAHFPVYRISETKVYVPKYYGIERYGETSDKLKDGKDAILDFRGELKPHQYEFCSKLLDEIRTKGSCIGSSQTGSGKCHAYNTKIMLHNGRFKYVQNIEVGDVLMGDDSTGRKVLSLGNGVDTLYTINPCKFREFSVNGDHILCLYDTTKKKVVEISVTDYISLGKKKKNSLYLYSLPIEYNIQHLHFDPYILGFWFGMGSPEIPQFHTKSMNILRSLSSRLSKYDMGIVDFDYVFDSVYEIVSLTPGKSFGEKMKLYGFCNLDRIPSVYLHNTRKNRLLLLAGLLDANCINNIEPDKYSFVTNYPTIAGDVSRLVRSLGYYVKVDVTDGNYRVIFYGIDISYIPCRNVNIKINNNIESYQLHKPYVLSSFTVTKNDIGSYYGFEIDGNGRYYMANHVITHNTTMALWLASELKKRTLIVVHKNFLLEQWVERIKQFLPNSSIGIIRQDQLDIDKDIVIGSIQTMLSRKYEHSVFEDIHFTIYDEVHHLGAKNFSKVLFMLGTKYNLGLSATPERSDGLTRVIRWFLGDIIVNNIYSNVEKPVIRIVSGEYSSDIRPKYNVREKLNTQDLINQLVNDPRRNELIIDTIEDLNKENRKVLVLSARRGHCEYLCSKLKEKKLSCGLYLGGMKTKDLEDSDTQDIIIATYSMVSEGYDNPALDTLVMATGITSVQQSIGRIIRRKNMFTPLVVDIVDMKYFKNQAYSRRRYYRKNGYEIINNYEDNESECNDEEDNSEVVKFEYTSPFG